MISKLLLTTIFFFLNQGVLKSQNKKLAHIDYYHPIDTLLVKTNLSPFQRLPMIGLKFWQMKSYNDPGLNCQFYPSCSNFCAISIYKEGSIIGISKGLDRFIRCNNSAQKKYKVYEYGTFNYGGNRLIDEYIEGSIKSNKSFYIGLGLTVVPGLGRAYYGQIEDAKNSFLYTVGFGLLSLIMKENSKDTISMGFAITSLFFWSTDFLALYKMDSIEK